MANSLQPAAPQRMLASSPTIAEAGQYLTFLLKCEIYALGILSIKEIIGYDRLTDVPMMPRFIRGVINLRGRVVPVIDLLSRFNQGTTTIAKRTSIVIVETTDYSDKTKPNGQLTDIGIIVDAVNEVVDITADTIEPAPRFGAVIRPEFIIGMARREGHFIVMLAVDKVLVVNEMTAIDQALFSPETTH